MSFTGGRLKLKGGVAVPGRKKKKSSKAKAAPEEALAVAVVEGETSAPPPPQSRPDRRTDAEKRHAAAVAAREAERIAALASKSHRERVAEFNDKLASLSEHHDIPKVGPG